MAKDNTQAEIFDALEEQPKREIAIFGGSFNPPHMGHVYVIAHVLATEPVDEIWLIPTHSHPFGKELASFSSRIEMCRTLESIFSGHVKVSEVEKELSHQDKKSYTVDTLRHLYKENKDTRFALIIGSDNLKDLHRWKEFPEIEKMVRLIVVSRGDYSPGFAGAIIPNVSSTRIREKLVKGEDLVGWVPLKVLELCKKKRWYA